MYRIKWGGSLASFIIIGVVFVFVVGGAAYYVQARGAQARQDTATQLAAKQAKQVAADQKAAESSNAAETTSSTNTSTTSAPTVASTTSTSSQLPHTGVTFSITEYLGAGLLVATVLSYLSSRRQLLRSL